MKTIKIPEQLHKDLRKLQAEWEMSTIYTTIRALYVFHLEITKERDNDKSKK